MRKVGVIGQGYVGLNLAMSIAERDFKVIGFELNERTLTNLSLGKSHIEGISDSQIRKYLSNKKYTPSNNLLEMDKCDIIIIAVPTPLDPQLKPDLSLLIAAVEQIKINTKSSKLIINESTSFPGTLRDEIASRFFDSSIFAHRFAIATERIDPGNNVWNITNTPRVVSGLTVESTSEVYDFYSEFTKVVIKVSSPEVAEMSKLIENSFRLINIAFVNEMAMLSKALDIPIYEVLDAAETKPYGYMRFNPGSGVGGHCIPVDPQYLQNQGNKFGFNSEMIEISNRINIRMPEHIINLISNDFNGNLRDKKIILIGVSYKPNISDTRDSTAKGFIRILEEIGSKVFWHDKFVTEWNNSKSSEISKYDIAIIITAHDYVVLEDLMDIPYIFDCTGKFRGYEKVRTL
jgi:UDP-N-acetyl-D-glucosamine dehydrogenase